MKQLKGSITIESAIILPLVICVLLTIGFTIRYIYVYETMDYMLTQAAYEIAEKGYLYDKSGLLDVQHQVEYIIEDTDVMASWSTLKEETISWEEALSSLDIANIISNFKSSFGQLSNETNTLTGMLDAVLSIKEKIGKLVDTEVVKKSKSLFTTRQSFFNNKETLLLSFGYKGFEKLKTIIGNSYVNGYIKRYYTKEDLMHLHVVDGEINLDQSKYFYKKEEKGLVVQDNITIVAFYQMKIPLPIQIIGAIPLKNQVTIRGWTGKNNYNAHLGESNGTITQNENKEEITVYHVIGTLGSEESTIYHIRSCSIIDRRLNVAQYSELNNKMLILSTETKERKLDLCSKCQSIANTNNYKPKKDDEIYYTKSGNKYHYYNDCGALQRIIKSMTLKDANNKGHKPCSVCNPPTVEEEN